MKQDKFWVRGTPHGERWEIYAVKEDSPTVRGEDDEQRWRRSKRNSMREERRCAAALAPAAADAGTVASRCC